MYTLDTNSIIYYLGGENKAISVLDDILTIALSRRQQSTLTRQVQHCG